MPAVPITAKTFNETIGKGGIVVLDFWASWCGPCKAFAPVFEKASEQHPDIVFGKVNTDEEQGLAGSFEIRAIPTLMVFRDRVLIFSQAGALPAAALEDVVKQARAVDMAEVHRKISEPTG